MEGAAAAHADAERGDLGAADVDARGTLAAFGTDVPLGQAAAGAAADRPRSGRDRDRSPGRRGPRAAPGSRPAPAHARPCQPGPG
ncbi:hypothetical protein G6F40_013830 [Rhizopus arrhizus]|nr:hypothetical protein G6F40_013830 [Rhizopus arrhizus]